MAKFTPVYQSVYDAALARQRDSEARQRAAATNSAARAGVMTSGVSQIPQEAIGQEALRSEADLGAKVAQAQEGERLQDKEFEQRKELMNLQATLTEAAAARERELLRKQGKSDITGQIVGGVVGGAGGAIAKKYFS